jgi:general secretion pathway protein G
MTVIELVLVAVILTILALAAMPLATWVHRRAQEDELRRALRTMRAAIDHYHDFARQGQIEAWDVEWDRYPKDIEMLIEGVEVTEGEAAEPYVVKFLRDVPYDPMTDSHDWGFRSYRDDHDASSWGGENLYDVYCLSTEYAMDGSRYSEW